MFILTSQQFKKGYRLLLVLFLVNLLACFLIYANRSRSLNEVYFLSVGEGDAELIRYRGKNILIDAGPDRQILKALGRVIPLGESIDLAVITHSNTDHYEGLRYVLESYPIRGVVMPEISNPNLTYQSLLEVLSQNGTKLYLAKAGNKIKLSANNFFQVLWPLTNNITSSVALNSQALVILYQDWDKSFLFTSDIGTKEEMKILALYPNLKADIIKIAHHGSKGSNSYDWLKALNPAYGIIEVGDNAYGHPTLEVLSRLASLNILTLRTDWQGSIGFVFKPNGFFDLVY
ncbi:MAG TPA: MBL fold metallo-hydrolase [Candidatus Paceibacterota bacterium]|nr:MBL fold metallo-hydrolase [Candidatus Paceibacterota bacterium]